jgi:nucleotide-binding universal stress UspA family protein
MAGAIYEGMAVVSKVDLPVVVGVDGSSASLAAVDYAVDEAAQRKSPLLILYGHLRHSPLSPWRTRTEPYVTRGIRRLLEAVADRARTLESSIDVSVELQLDEPGAAIVGRSDRARLVVVGHSGRGAAALGSVAAYVTSHASCPVIVHRPNIGARDGSSPVTVGVDGSALSGAALDFALEEAALRGADLNAVFVWTHPPGAAPAGLHPVRYTFAEARDEAERMLAEQLAGASATYPDVRVAREVVHSLDTTRTLMKRSGQAQLMVVGSRGRGGMARLLLGSVSQALINHASCPVAVVRHNSLG